MASEIWIAQDHISLPHYSEEKGYDDHLFENQILDIDEEPMYENCDILKDISNNNKVEYHTSTPVSNSLTIYIGDQQNNKFKNFNAENIYENLDFVQDCFSNENKIYNGNNKLEKTNYYRSTLSLTIGKSNNEIGTVNIVEADDVSNNKCLNEKESSRSKYLNQMTNDEDSSDGSFKSSYAKSLIDSFHHNDSLHNNLQENYSKKSSSSILLNHKENQFLVNGDCTHYKPSKVIDCSHHCSGHLESKVKTLTDNLAFKDKELDKLKQDIMSLRLECNKIRSENRSLRIAQNMNMRNSPIYLNGENNSQPGSLTSLSTDSDTWTLQQQLLSLNSQLEKAELSRHAYEAATKQLVNFLQTINTTLTTVASPGNSQLNSLPFYKLNAIETLKQSEKLLNKQYSLQNINKDRHILSNGDLHHSTNIDNKAGRRDRNGRRSKSLLANEYNANLPSNNNKLSKISLKKEKHSEKEEEKITSVSTRNVKNCSEKKNFRLENYSPIDHLSWNGVKRNGLIRSESVSHIPIQQITPIARVNRAVSSHCVTSHAIYLNETGEEEEEERTSASSSHRLGASKAKGFFCSLKNLFHRSESSNNDKSQSVLSNGPPSSRRKTLLPLKYRSNKYKCETCRESPLSLPDSSFNNSNFILKKSNSMKIDNKISTDLNFKRNLDNSIFYVPCDTTVEEDSNVQLDNEDVCEVSAEESIDSGKDSVPETNSKDFNKKNGEESTHSDEELSGPQEISVTLSISKENLSDSPGTRTYHHHHYSSLIGQGNRGVGQSVVNNYSFSTNQPTSINSSDGIGFNHDIIDSLNSNCESTALDGRIPIFHTHNGSNMVNLVGNSIGSNNNDIKNVGFTFVKSPRKSHHNRRNGVASLGCQEYLNRLKSLRLKETLWKLCRSSYRDPGCRLEFV